jgi:hypothetical protein
MSAPIVTDGRRDAGSRTLRVLKFVAVFLFVPVLTALVISGVLLLVDAIAHNWLQQSGAGVFLKDQFLFTYGALIFFVIAAWIWAPIFYALVCLMSPAHPVWIYAAIGALLGFFGFAPFTLPLVVLGGDVDLDFSGRLHAAGTLVQATLLACVYALALRFSLSSLGLIGSAKPKRA